MLISLCADLLKYKQVNQQLEFVLPDLLIVKSDCAVTNYKPYICSIEAQYPNWPKFEILWVRLGNIIICNRKE